MGSHQSNWEGSNRIFHLFNYKNTGFEWHQLKKGLKFEGKMVNVYLIMD